MTDYLDHLMIGPTTIRRIHPPGPRGQCWTAYCARCTWHSTPLSNYWITTAHANLHTLYDCQRR